MYDSVIFDLDGTIYIGDQLIPGARSAIETLRQAGVNVGFATNNTTKTPLMYAEKLRDLGVRVREEFITNPISPLLEWLRKEAAGAGVFALCEDPMLEVLRDSGVHLVDSVEHVDVVVASFDRTLTYEKLRIAFQSLWGNPDCRLVATNLDLYCPLPGQSGEPDAGATVAALEASTNVRCEAVFGKPSAALFRSACASLGADPERSLMVGDRLATDIAIASAVGADSALVLTGDSQLSDIPADGSRTVPTYVLDSVASIPEAIGLAVRQPTL